MSKSLNNENFSRKQETLFTFIEDEFQVFYQDIIDKQTLPNLNIQDEDIKIYLYIKMLKYTHQELYNDLRDSAKKQQELQENSDNSFKNKEQELPKINLLKSKKQFLPIIDIMHYMLSQYFRTKKIISNLKKVTMENSKKISAFIEQNLPNENFDSNNLIFLFVQIQPILQLNNIIKNDYRLLLIKNCTHTFFNF